MLRHSELGDALKCVAWSADRSKYEFNVNDIVNLAVLQSAIAAARHRPRGRQDLSDCHDDAAGVGDHDLRARSHGRCPRGARLDPMIAV